MEFICQFSPSAYRFHCNSLPLCFSHKQLPLLISNEISKFRIFPIASRFNPVLARISLASLPFCECLSPSSLKTDFSCSNRFCSTFTIPFAATSSKLFEDCGFLSIKSLQFNFSKLHRIEARITSS